MHHHLSVFLLVVALSAAGCLGDEAPDDALTKTAEEGPDVTAAPDDTTLAQDPAPLETIAVHVEDGTNAAAVVCPPVRNHCPGVGNWPGYAHEGEMDGLLDGIALTLTWDAAAPGNEQMLFYMYACLGDECAPVASTQGVSPLSLDTVEAAGPFDRFVVEVSTPNRVPHATVFASPEQPFLMDGTITVARMPDV